MNITGLAQNLIPGAGAGPNSSSNGAGGTKVKTDSDEAAEKFAEERFKEIMTAAFGNLQIKTDIQSACDFQKNTEILDIIHSRIKNHIEETFSKNDNADDNPADKHKISINDIVFQRLMKLIETPGTELNKSIKDCMRKYPQKQNTNFFHLLKHLPEYIRSVYGVECSQAPIKGGNPLNKEINKCDTQPSINNDTKQKEQKTIVKGGNPPNAVEVRQADVDKHLNKIISEMKTKIADKLAETVNVMFADPLSKVSINLRDYTEKIVKQITERIGGSAVLNGGDFFSVIYFYLMLEKLRKNNNQEKIDKINLLITKILDNSQQVGSISNITPPPQSPVAAIIKNPVAPPFKAELLQKVKTINGGRRTKRLPRRKKRTQKKRFNRKKSITYRKK